MKVRDDFKIHWFYTHWHWPTLQNGRTYPDPERLSEDEKPYGAFILAIQAVSHLCRHQ